MTSLGGYNCSSALDLLKQRAKAEVIQPLSFGCPIIDEKIGGIPCGGITEISGEAGCGKTQFCLTLTLQVQLDAFHGGKSSSAAYLSCGEGSFPIRRLAQMANGYEQRTGVSHQTYLSRVHIEHCYNADDAQAILRHKIPDLCRNKGVKLLVIDSLAGLLRFEYDHRDAREMHLRTALLFQLAKELKLLSDMYSLTIVVVNQVKASGFTGEYGEAAGINSFSISPSGEIMRASSSSYSSSSSSVPAMGQAWSHCINTRLTLQNRPPSAADLSLNAPSAAAVALRIQENRRLEGEVKVGVPNDACVENDVNSSNLDHKTSSSSQTKPKVATDKGDQLEAPVLSVEEILLPYTGFPTCIEYYAAASTTSTSSSSSSSYPLQPQVQVDTSCSSAGYSETCSTSVGGDAASTSIDHTGGSTSNSSTSLRSSINMNTSTSREQRRRWIRLDFSPIHAAPAYCAYEIHTSGVVGNHNTC